MLTDAKLQDLRPALCLALSLAEGNAISKQRMAHWIVVAITLAYKAQGVPCPFRLRAYSTRSVVYRFPPVFSLKRVRSTEGAPVSGRLVKTAPESPIL